MFGKITTDVVVFAVRDMPRRRFVLSYSYTVYNYLFKAETEPKKKKEKNVNTRCFIIFFCVIYNKLCSFVHISHTVKLISFRPLVVHYAHLHWTNGPF